jgi:hypothetical protein
MAGVGSAAFMLPGAELDTASREILLVEYQKAQDSAEHHDGLVGSFTALWVGSAVLMGFVLSGLASRHAHQERVVMLFLVGLGAGVTLLVAWWVFSASKMKRTKYDRCKDIEKLLGMEQHSTLTEPTTWWKSHWQTVAYILLMAGFFAAWMALLVSVLGGHSEAPTHW